ncbi:MAG: tetratricopeptide repeat protein, partial [Myxococcaceae bacterium]
GLFRLVHGRDAEAVAPLRAACALSFPGDEAATANRLSFLLNLGRALDRSGASDEAEKVLREGLIGREALYGRNHPGFAFGLEPLAEVLLRRGRIAEARAAIVEAVQIFLDCEHRRFATAAALQAEVLKTIDPGARVFGFLEPLEDEELAEVVEAVIKRRGLAPPVARRRALEELSEVLAEELGPSHTLRTRVLAELAAT